MRCEGQFATKERYFRTYLMKSQSLTQEFGETLDAAVFMSEVVKLLLRKRALEFPNSWMTLLGTERR
jgi:hypothetical protein